VVHHVNQAIWSQAAKSGWPMTKAHVQDGRYNSVVAVLFLGSFFALNMPAVIASLFVAAMLCLIMALLNFICEIYLATAHVRSGP
jgi:hypothetical protein